MINHSFTGEISKILKKHFGDKANVVFETSSLLQYLNIKTKSANSGSKSRGSFASIYALFVLLEDYNKRGFSTRDHGKYSKYEGAKFSDLSKRQKQLPFGAKLQNHALNSRMNEEYLKYFPSLDERPIIHDVKNQRYWINESLIDFPLPGKSGKERINIARAILDVIVKYIEIKRASFTNFISVCKKLTGISSNNKSQVSEFVKEQLKPNVDARLFEIVSYAILKAHFNKQTIFWGWSKDKLNEVCLALFKTGRTNANDGGIDFVMRPFGRFFQVTETIDANKYFLDIDKIQRFPLTFVVKTTSSHESIIEILRQQAKKKYSIDAVVKRYIDCVEEIMALLQTEWVI